MDSGVKFFRLLCLTLLVTTFRPELTDAQRSLLHWRHDLEYRLDQYQRQQQNIQNVISTSVHPTIEPSDSPARISAGNVRFSDLIIPSGALVFESHVAQPTVRVLVNKTQSYVASKMSDLYQIRSQLEIVKQQLNDPAKQFIHKGSPNQNNLPQVPIRVTGTRVFKQFTYAHSMKSNLVQVKQINYTSVDHVLNETYMVNSKFGILDSKQRLFFEGRKTLWRTLFTGHLKSGCCDRLRPLHTNRMMTRSTYQEVMAPVMLNTNGPRHKEKALIVNLATRQIYNRKLAFSNRQDDNGLIPSVYENFIHLNNLINIRHSYLPEIIKTIVFTDALIVEEADVGYSPTDSRVLIRFLSRPDLNFDLSHDNHLLKYQTNRSAVIEQHVPGTVIINGDSQFNWDVSASFVNQVYDFKHFAQETVVRIDRPAVIRGSIQFNALPTYLNRIGQVRLNQGVRIMAINGQFQVNLLNGMRYPHDLVMLPLRQTDMIRVRGPRHFVNPVSFEFLQVNQSVAGMLMPAGVIPLHLNDVVGSVGRSNLWFVDGIMTNQVTVQSGMFDEIVIKENFGDAQSLIVRSVFTNQPDGSHLIRAPLRVGNLRLLGNGLNRGLLNGFRPEDLIELSRQVPREIVYGRKHFLAPVEATECVFSEINGLANWTNHLIRIDRPNTIQNVHTRLAFVQPKLVVNISNPAYLAPQAASLYELPSSVNIKHLDIEFSPNNNPVHYMNNLRFSPEFYILHRALMGVSSNESSGRYRVLDQVRLMSPLARINGVALDDIVTLDAPFRFTDRFVMVGKVEVVESLRANRITSNYPIDRMDLEQFQKYRIPLLGGFTSINAPIRLDNLVLSSNNRATFVQTRLLNGISFSEFAAKIMSLTRAQVIHGEGLVFAAPIHLEGIMRTSSSLNGIKRFSQFAQKLKTARYTFEDGLQCSSVMIKV